MQSTTAQRGIHWPSVVQFLFSIMALILVWGAAVVFLVSGLAAWMQPSPSMDDVALNWMRTAGLALAGLLLVPSTLFSFLRMIGQPFWGWLTSPFWKRLPMFLIPLWPFVLLLGHWIATQTDFSWLFLPPLTVLGVGLPILFWFGMGSRGLSAGSPQRAWGILAAGLVLGPALIMIAELFGIVLIAVAAGIAVAMNPAWQTDLSLLAQRLMNSSGDLEAITRILRPYLNSPWLLFGSVASLGILVPLVEETLKPVGMYFLAGKHLTPAEGFVGGLISGAGYTLFESMNTSTSLLGEVWAPTTFARAGTDLVHVVATGLMGWALVSAWSERRYLRLGATFLVSVMIHGIWNSVSVAGTILPLMQDATGGLAWLGNGEVTTTIALIVLVLMMFLILLRANREMRKTQKPVTPASPAPVQKPVSSDIAY